MRTVAIVQARMASTRLPGKVMMDIAGRPMLAHVVGRAQRAERLDEVVVATTERPEDNAICAWGDRAGVRVFRGSEQDVLDRYHATARATNAELIVRVTADCPLLDPGVIDAVVAAYRPGDHDYVSNVEPPTYPDGLDTEVFPFAVLDRAWREATLGSEREHVTPYVRKRPREFRQHNVVSPRDLSDLRWTVDEPRDLAFVRGIFARLPEGRLDHAAVLDLLAREPDLALINAGIQRNEGYLKSLREDSLAAPPRRG